MKIINIVALLTIISMSLLLTFPALASLPPEMQSTLDEYLRTTLEAAHVPGAQAVVVDSEGILFSNCYGDSATVNSPFVIGSMSKSFTAVAIMQLAEEAKVDLDVPLSAYLGAKYISEALSEQVTIRQLLNQTSGIRDYDVDTIKTLHTQGEFFYSNANYGLLGRVVEMVSGQEYGTYIREHIFTPLQMNHSFANRSDAIAGGLVPGHQNYFGFPIARQMEWPERYVPSGYLVSSANDMGNYLRMYLNGGILDRAEVLNSKSIDEMWRGVVNMTGAAADASNTQYGMGWMRWESNGMPVTAHPGNVENFSSFMAVLPQQGVAVVLLYNADDMLVGQNMVSEINQGVIDILIGQDAPSLTTGVYQTKHLILNMIYGLFIFLCALPLIRLKRWKKNLKSGKKAGRIALMILIHLAAPLLFPIGVSQLGYSFAVIVGFAPEVIIVMICCVGLLFGVGAYKTVTLIQNKYI